MAFDINTVFFYIEEHITEVSRLIHSNGLSRRGLSVVFMIPERYFSNDLVVWCKSRFDYLTLTKDNNQHDESVVVSKGWFTTFVDYDNPSEQNPSIQVLEYTFGKYKEKPKTLKAVVTLTEYMLTNVLSQVLRFKCHSKEEDVYDVYETLIYAPEAVLKKLSTRYDNMISDNEIVYVAASGIEDSDIKNIIGYNVTIDVNKIKRPRVRTDIDLSKVEIDHDRRLKRYNGVYHH